MWQVVNESLSNFCSSTFWDSNLTWNTPDPEFTRCFDYTILTWFPCLFLWILLPLEIHFLRRASASNIPFNLYNIFKLVMIVFLKIPILVDATIYFLRTDQRESIFFLDPLTKFMTFCLFSILTYANIKCGIRSSGILFLFSLFLAFCGAPRLYSKLRSLQRLMTYVEKDATQEFLLDIILYFIYYASVLIVLFLNCFADAPPVDYGKKNSGPLYDSSFLSKIFSAWFDRVVWKKYRNPPTDNDVWELGCQLRTEHLVRKFESKWKCASQKHRKKMDSELESIELNEVNRTNPVSILWPLCEVFGSTFVSILLIEVIIRATTLYTTQILILILDFVSEENEFRWHSYFYAILMLVNLILQKVFLHYSFHLCSQAGLEIRTVLVSFIYKKIMSISNEARKNFTFGKIVNLVAVDVQGFNNVMFSLTSSIITVGEICVCIYWLWNILGPSILAGLAVLILLTILSTLIMSKIQKLQTKRMKLKDKRIQLINEILAGIKVLKLYACEPSFEEQVVLIRAKEVEVMQKISYLLAVSSCTWMSTPFLVSLVTFGVYVLSSEENVLNVQLTFASLSLFNVIKISMRKLPTAFTGMLQVHVVLKRINDFLNCEDLEFDAVSHHSRREPIVIDRGNFSWDSEESSLILININLKVEPGSLVGIVGPVGSGKSSLLAAILGEMYKKSGVVNTTGTLAYVPQQAWIQNDTLKNNITFGKTSENLSYSAVLEACALMPDVKVLPGGDQTEIGEKGINLSGGQKQRISLARSVYSDADIYLLDDPLSAVDAHVGKHIFEKVIGPNGLLKGKTRLFVTHNVTYLPHVDYIVVLQGGIISQSGTYKELMNVGEDLARFLSIYLTEHDNDRKTAEEKDEDCVEQALTTTNENASHMKRRRNTPIKEENEETMKQSKYKLTETEKVRTGNVKWKLYAFYLGAVGPAMVTLVLLTNIICQLSLVASDYWLSVWSSDTEISKHPVKQHFYLGVYAFFGAVQAISVMGQTIALYVGVLKAARFVHNRLLSAVLHWPSTTFDRIPLGRIMNRFSADVEVLDNTLPANFLQMLTYAGLVLSVLCVISYNLPKFLGVFLFLGAVFFFILKINGVVSKQIRRLESVSKSPIFTHLDDTITGAQSIRAYGMQSMFIETFMKKVDFNHQNHYVGLLLQRWFMTRLSLTNCIIVFITTLFGVLNKDTIGSAIVGLTITYSLQMGGYFNWWVRGLADVEKDIIAIERIKEYNEIEGEAPWEVPSKDKEVPKDWPSKGEIVFKDLHVRYQKDLEPVLRGVSFKVNHGERVGIVGRTGAGKSSLTLSLFRIIECDSGGISIDGIDISQIGLHTLRSRLTIIPQDPALFMGSLRFNLDPWEKYSDESVWRALELAKLKEYISSRDGGLQYTVDEGGRNFSVGQRQLICLARALLRKTRILVLDEATAAVDFETDDLIQETIRNEFNDCSVLTIAHRLNTVFDYDKIVVLDRGYVVEYDSPGALLESNQSLFYKMAVAAGLIRKMVAVLVAVGQGELTVEDVQLMFIDPAPDSWPHNLAMAPASGLYLQDIF